MNVVLLNGNPDVFAKHLDCLEPWSDNIVLDDGNINAYLSTYYHVAEM